MPFGNPFTSELDIGLSEQGNKCLKFRKRL